MARIKRAAQFAPFDALKGLKEALRLKEYEHDRIIKGDASETDAEEISDALFNAEKGDVLKITFFSDGHYFTRKGSARIEVEKGVIELRGKTEKTVIKIEDITRVINLTKEKEE